MAVKDVAAVRSGRYAFSTSAPGPAQAISVPASGPILSVAPVTTAGPLYELQPLEPDTRPDAKVASTITPCGTSVIFPDTANELRRQLMPSIVPPVPPAGLGELPAAVQAAVATAIAPMAMAMVSWRMSSGSLTGGVGARSRPGPSARR